MGRPSLTASAIVNFAEKLEEYSSKLYEALAQIYVERKETFLSFAEESKKNKLLISRTYQETVSDALEACFSFEGLNLNNYAFETTSRKGDNCSNALEAAIDLEKKACKFYLDITVASKGLLATIPRAFNKVAERRNKRRVELRTILNDVKH